MKYWNIQVVCNFGQSNRQACVNLIATLFRGFCSFESTMIAGNKVCQINKLGWAVVSDHFCYRDTLVRIEKFIRRRLVRDLLHPQYFDKIRSCRAIATNNKELQSALLPYEVTHLIKSDLTSIKFMQGTFLPRSTFRSFSNSFKTKSCFQIFAI